MGNQQGKGRSSQGRRIDWDNAEKPLPPGKPYLVPDCDERGSEFITVRWAPPVSDGGAPILGYVVEHRKTGSPHWLRALPYLSPDTKLTLTGLEPGWRYQFRVSAENDMGRSDPGEVSEVLTVTSQRTAATSPYFNVELRDTVALENEKVEFVVHVVAVPQAKISWYKDGFEVFSSRRMKIVTENDQSTFIIHQAALEDEGEIKCTATNRAGHTVTKAILKLEAPPRIRLPRQYEDGLLFEKEELIRLKVSVAGRPTPTVTWYHNGELLQNNARYEISDAERTSMLRISEARREDRGEYLIRGVNKIGEDISSFLVTVTDRPQPPGKTKVVMALGRSVTLSWTSPEDDGGCKIGSYTVEYFRVGWNMWLKATTCRQLTTVLSELIEGSEYKFRVKAENPYGMSDPGEPSDVVFIPDIKRGVLTPPSEARTPSIDLWLDQDGTPAAEQDPDRNFSRASEKRKILEENARKILDSPFLNFSTTAKDDEKAVDRSKRSHDDLEADNVPPPVPKRRHKGDKPPRTPSPNHPTDADAKKISDDYRPSPAALASEGGQRGHRAPATADDVGWEGTIREKDHTLFHGSSELMLVLLPQEESRSIGLSPQQRSEVELSLFGSGVAPPMSLSSPELGSCEPMEPPLLREAVSSSELLHERAMTRMYQDVVDEETQMDLRTRYGSDRKSLERRSSMREGSFSERRHSFKEGMLTDRREFHRAGVDTARDAKTTTSGKPHSSDLLIGNDSKKEKPSAAAEQGRKQRLSSIEKEEWEFAQVRKRIQMKKEESLRRRNASSRSISSQQSASSTSSRLSSSWGEDDGEEDEEEEDLDYLDDDDMEEYPADEPMTSLKDIEYRPKAITHILPNRKSALNRVPQHLAPRAEGEDDTLIPSVTSRIVLPRLEITPAADSPLEKPEPQYRSPHSGLLENEVSETSPVAPKKRKKRAAKILKKLGLKRDKKIPEIVVEVDSSNPGSPLPLPKPILKNKPIPKKKEKDKRSGETTDQSRTSCDDTSDDGSSVRRKKQVRIAEPSEMNLADGGATTGKSIAERRSADENEQANRVVICHYSDIVREFGHGKRPPTRQYLRREELEAVARGSDQRTDDDNPIAPPETVESGTIERPEGEDRLPSRVRGSPSKSTRSSLDYITDMAMFLVACWLYLFSNELYAVPVLCLMAYRQVNDIFRKKYSSIAEAFSKRFVRNKNLENG